MGEIRGVATAETLAVQMEGDSRRLPRLAGGHPNLWPQPVQSFIRLWICLAPLHPPPTPSQSLLHPRENFLKNVHNQRSRLGCRVASFSRWKLALASSHPQSKIASSCLYSKWTIPFLFLQSVDKSMSIDKEPALTTAKEKILSKIANSRKCYDWRMPLKTGGGPTVTENSWSSAECREDNFKFPTKRSNSLSTTTLDLLQLSLHLFAIIHNCQGHLQDLKVSKGSKQPSGAIRPSRGTILWLLCAIFFLVLKLTSTYKGGTTNLNSWYWGMECNRVKFPNSGIAIALEFREGQFNIRPGVETFTAISRMFYLL